MSPESRRSAKEQILFVAGTTGDRARLCETDEALAVLDLGQRTVYRKHAHIAHPSPRPHYLGRSMDELAASGRDVLAEAVLAQGEPSRETVEGLLPELTRGTYQILGSPASPTNYVCRMDGTIQYRPVQSFWTPLSVFSPIDIDARLAGTECRTGALDGWLPIQSVCYTGNGFTCDQLAFVPPEESSTLPELFIRFRRNVHDPNLTESVFLRVNVRNVGSFPHEREIPAEMFYRHLLLALQSWESFLRPATRLNLPDPDLCRAVKGALAYGATYFSGPCPHYGGAERYAGYDSNDFVPTVLTAARTYRLLGMGDYADDIFFYYLLHRIRPDGSSHYDLFQAVTATEYADFFVQAERRSLRCDGVFTSRVLDRLEAMGHYLLRRRIPAGKPYAGLLRMEAEADNVGRPRVYVSNNVWAIRGFTALARLLDHAGRRESAEAFSAAGSNIDQRLRDEIPQHAVSSEFGPLVPSYFGYPAPPHTLASDVPLPAGLDDNEVSAYHAPQEAANGQQWLRENTYANYRYHPETLGAMALETRYAEALLALRQGRGGAVLGMTRIFGNLDDWPILPLAHYYLVTGRIDDYLLVLYAHYRHHGQPDIHTYYEQRGLDDAAGYDCLPSLLLVPQLLAWALVFEPWHEEALYLLRGVPLRWLEPGQAWSFKEMDTTWGSVSVKIEVTADKGGCKRASLELELPDTVPVGGMFLDLRGWRGVRVVTARGGTVRPVPESANRLKLLDCTGRLNLSLKERVD